MKPCSILTALLAVFASHYAFAQIDFPDLSYHAQVKQKVGFTNFTIDYERPLQRGRLIFGGLVRFGKPWRTGAGFHNTISFDQDVFIKGKKIAKGSYHLITIPDPKTWKIILSTDSNAFAQNKPYEPEKEVIRIDADVEVSKEHYEACTIDLDIVNNDAYFTISWDKTSVRFIVNTGTTQRIMNEINKMIKSEVVDPDQYAEAADFIAYNLTSLSPGAADTAVYLVNKAIEKKPAEWMYRVKQNIYLFKKDFKGFEQVSNEWIAFDKKVDPNHQDIERIKKDVEYYRNILR